MTRAQQRRRAWFARGARAAAAVDPTAAAAIAAGSPYYACPICLRFFSEGAVAQGLLTIEDVPPKSVGGRPMVLTCKDCNNSAGRDLDAHAHRAELMRQFKTTHQLPRTRARVRLAGDERWVASDVAMSAQDGHIVLKKKGSRAGNAEALEAALSAHAAQGTWRELEIKLSFPALTHNVRRANASWLRAAYLAQFALWGYRLVLTPDYERIRKQFQDPLASDLEPFVFTAPVRERGIWVVVPPSTEAGFFVMMGPRFVYLPWPGDATFWERLHARAGRVLNLTVTGKRAPWPAGPAFWMDLGEPTAEQGS